MAQRVYFNGFVGGINQALSPKDIGDHELADALNFEFDEKRGLRKRDGVDEIFAVNPVGAKIESIYEYRTQAGGSTVIYTEGAKVWRAAAADPTTASETEITNLLTFGAAQRWQWVTFDDVAIGVNQTDTGDANSNPVKLPSTTGLLALLGGSPPKGNYIAVWNRRLWIVDADNPSVLKGSALGDAEDWASSGGSGTVSMPVGEDEGERITGIYPFHDMLIIFKRSRTYALIPGSPNVDARQYEIKSLSSTVGCVSIFTAQEVLNDLVFLSDYGVMSLQAVSSYGDFRKASLSANVPKFLSIDKDSDIFASVVNPEKMQYWIAIPGASSDTTNTEVWVMDFRGLASGQPVAWTRWDGGPVGASYGKVFYDGRPRMYIGGYTNGYIMDESFQDDSVDAGYEPTTVSYLTKAISMDEPLSRKEFYRFGLEFEAETDPVNFNITWKMDLDETRTKTVSGQFSNLVTGSLLDGDDTLSDAGDPDFMLATEASEDTDLIWAIRGPAGRRAQTVQFEFQNDDFTQGYVIKRMMLEFDYLRGIFAVSDYSV
jgi:hypothetical protein